MSEVLTKTLGQIAGKRRKLQKMRATTPAQLSSGSRWPDLADITLRHQRRLYSVCCNLGSH